MNKQKCPYCAKIFYPKIYDKKTNDVQCPNEICLNWFDLD